MSDTADNVYQDVEDFVTAHLAPMLCRRPPRWCEQWWRHPEAVDRLTGLWLAWEALCSDEGVGLSSWWVNHADDHLRALCDPSGPFAACSDSHTDKLQPLAVVPAPAGWWDR